MVKPELHPTWTSLIEQAIADWNVGRNQRNHIRIAWGPPQRKAEPWREYFPENPLCSLLNFRGQDFDMFVHRQERPAIVNACELELYFRRFRRLPRLATDFLFNSLANLQPNVCFMRYPLHDDFEILILGVTTVLDLDTLTGDRLRDALRQLSLSAHDSRDWLERAPKYDAKKLWG